jgi:hypothetical protein
MASEAKAVAAVFYPQPALQKGDTVYLVVLNQSSKAQSRKSTVKNTVAVLNIRQCAYPRYRTMNIEGSKGLTILEVADRIQKSGLRDLSTSKTPEASIAVALSRDANLFERVIPSTYYVRPAFRKDPCDAEAVLQTTREKIQLFQSGFSDSEETEIVTKEIISKKRQRLMRII